MQSSFTRAVLPIGLGLTVFAVIAFANGTESLSRDRFLIAALTCWVVTGLSVFAIRHWYGDRS